jgi:hypothetical protein
VASGLNRGRRPVLCVMLNRAGALAVGQFLERVTSWMFQHRSRSARDIQTALRVRTHRATLSATRRSRWARQGGADLIGRKAPGE